MQMKAKGHQEPDVVVHRLQQKQADLCEFQTRLAEWDPVSEKERKEKNEPIPRALYSYANPNFWKEQTFLHNISPMASGNETDYGFPASLQTKQL